MEEQGFQNRCRRDTPGGNYRFDVPTTTPKKEEDFKQELKEASKDSFGALVKIVKILAPVIFILYIIINSEAVMSHVNEIRVLT